MKVFFPPFLSLILFTGCVNNINLSTSSNISESVEILNNLDIKCKERYLQKQIKSSNNTYGLSLETLSALVKIDETDDKTYLTPKINEIDGCVDKKIEQIRKIEELKNDFKKKENK